MYSDEEEREYRANLAESVKRMRSASMDPVDTAQQRQIDGLIIGFSIVGFLMVIWSACLTIAITLK